MKARTAGLIGAGLVLAALGLGTVALVLIDRAMGSAYARVAAAMPAGWADILRARTRVPAEVHELTLTRQGSGNGAEAVFDTVRGSWQRMRLDSAFARLAGGAATAADSILWREAEADTVLDRWVRFARRARWDSAPLILAHSGADAAHNLMAWRTPDYRRVLHATEVLALRGWRRADRRDRVGAQDDLGAAMSLGEMLIRHEATIEGLIAGRLVVHRAATALAHLAAIEHDTALARRAGAAGDWSQASTAGDYSILRVVPDTALAFAADSTLAAGWRAASLAGAMSGALKRPSGIVFGLSERLTTGIAAIARGADAPFRATAENAAATAAWINDLGPLGRLRLSTGRSSDP